MRVLVVEDDTRTASYIEKGLKEAGHVVAVAHDGEEGLHLAREDTFDVMVVDRMLPGRDGLSLIQALRDAGKTTPILILSARSSVDDRVEGLHRGGDDYLVKPFAFSELLARIQALARRAQSVPDATVLSLGGLAMDLIARRVTREGRRIDLQPREFALLEYLMRNAGHVVSKTMIMEHVWDYNFDPQTNVVETRVCRLRDKVDRGFETSLIHTVRGAGYVLRKES